MTKEWQKCYIVILFSNHIKKNIYSQTFILGNWNLKCAKGSDALNQMTGKSAFHRLPTNYRLFVMFNNGVPARSNSRIDYISFLTDIWSHFVFSVSVTMNWFGLFILPNRRIWVDELMDSAGFEEMWFLIEMLAADVQKLNKKATLHEHRSPPAVGVRQAQIKTHREPRGDRTCLTHRIVSSCRFLELHFSFVVQIKPPNLPDTLVVQIITLTSTPSKLITASPSWELMSISAAFMHLKLDSVVSAQTTIWTFGPAANYRQVFDCTACFISLSLVNVCFKRPRSKTARSQLFTENTLSFIRDYNYYHLLTFPVFCDVQLITEQETGAELAMLCN